MVASASASAASVSSVLPSLADCLLSERVFLHRQQQLMLMRMMMRQRQQKRQHQLQQSQ